MSETLTFMPDGRTELRMERRLPHPPEKVWTAITEPEHLKAWFPFQVELDVKVGGAMTFRDKGLVLHGEVLELDRPRVFAFDWQGELLRFVLAPTEDGTLLVFSHTFGDRYGAASFAAGWMACLDALEDDLAGRPIRKPTDMAATHDRLVSEFGLDEAIVEETADGWQLRFERQLTRPNEVAWSVLVGDNKPVIDEPAPPRAVIPGINDTRITAVEEAALLEYEWRTDDQPPGLVRLEFGKGTGQGGRLIVTQTGPPRTTEVEEQAKSAWKTRLAELADQLRATPAR